MREECPELRIGVSFFEGTLFGMGLKRNQKDNNHVRGSPILTQPHILRVMLKQNYPQLPGANKWWCQMLITQWCHRCEPSTPAAGAELFIISPRAAKHQNICS